MTRILIVGGGIGGMAAALACRRSGLDVCLLEQAQALSEVGAGLQLGPNAVRWLDAWGLGAAARRVAARPQRLRVLDSSLGRSLATLPLGDAFTQRYGTDYLSFHRADLLDLLVQAAHEAGARLELDCQVRAWEQSTHGVELRCADGSVWRADGLIGADGVWSRVRQQLLDDGPPLATGHLAYRTLLQPEHVPPQIAPDEVTVWLGARMHAVAYPVRAGALFNLVVIVEGESPANREDWSHEANGQHLLQRLANEHTVLQRLVAAAAEWKLWALHDRPPVAAVQEMVRGRVALLGDASHAMRPYQAQGAGMALEDAAQLGGSLALGPVPEALQHYALARWQRNAWIQSRSRRNGRVFHADGWLRLARNLALRVAGPALMDSPELYGR